MDGILIVDKPIDWTSHDVVARVRHQLKTKRVGHTGTLDPFATGVLVVLVGCATRLAQFLAGAEKEYEAVIRFGYSTDTGDLTGARRADDDKEADAAPTRLCSHFTADEIDAALAPLRGEIEQVPPMYSAKKIKGQKLYELARRGIEVERAAVRVLVGEFVAVAQPDGALLRANDDGETCDLRARVVCSAGTYVRTLAELVGENLKVGAHLAALRRTRAGAFTIEQALTLESLAERAKTGALVDLLLPLEAALPNVPRFILADEAARRVRHGGAVDAPEALSALCVDGAPVQLFDGAGALLAVAFYDATTRRLQPRVMLALEEK